MSELVQLIIGGLSLGSLYALLALGFVVVYKSTGVLNFAQGGLVLCGAYFCYALGARWGLPFPLAMLLAVLGTALVAVVAERFVMRRLIGKPVFAVIMVTWGLLIVIEQFPTSVWGYDLLPLGDPWAMNMAGIGGVQILTVDLWTLGISAVVMAAVYIFFRHSRYGLAMRASAFDQEAAMAQGVSPALVFALAWAIAGVIAALAGVMLSGGVRGLSPELSLVALRAFPAIILGGIDSPVGAVVGGLAIGVAEVLTASYVAQHAPWLGQNFHLVMPYLLMTAFLLVRPYGMFGTQAVRRG
ncbi:branched-chain amino acid transport system permease protein [Aquamicrobium terrae]